MFTVAPYKAQIFGAGIRVWPSRAEDGARSLVKRKSGTTFPRFLFLGRLSVLGSGRRLPACLCRPVTGGVGHGLG